jgi:hypothetical protein
VPPIAFDLTVPGGYVRSFPALHQAVSGRVSGHVVELNVALAGGAVNVFLEAASLYLVAVRAVNGNVLVLDGGKEQSYLPYFPAKEFGTGVVDTGIPARYDGETWKLTFTTTDLGLAADLPAYITGGNHTAAKAAIDRLAFAIAEAARFIPVRCAVACELADDLEFKEIIARLVTWTGGFVLSERNVSGSAKLEDLSTDDIRLRQRLGDQNMKVFRVNENAFVNLIGAARWLAILRSAQSDWSAKDKERMRSIRSSATQYITLRLGDFRALVTNWEKFSAIAHRDPNFGGLLDAFHVRYAVGSVPAEDSIYLAEWK